MKIKEILHENVTDIIARFYKEASVESDRFMNPENVKYKDINKTYYEKYFKEDIIPVFEKPVTEAQPEYRVTPKQGKLQSPGYRGLQYALAHAGLPYNHNVQRYNPAVPLASTSGMDAARNNNGQ